MSEESVGSLEEQSLKRKERLKALKRKHEDTVKDGNKQEDKSTEDGSILPR